MGSHPCNPSHALSPCKKASMAVTTASRYGFRLIGGTGSIQPVEAGSINVNAVSQYTTKKKSSRAQVTSVTQFSDVYPTDWAYQALSNLVEQYGCVAGYPNGTFRGNRAMTRYEAAALLNACLNYLEYLKAW